MKKTAFLFVLIFFPHRSYADQELVLFPERSLKDPTLTTVLFEDPSLSFLFRTEGRTVGTIGASLPLLKVGDDAVFAQAGVECSLRVQGAAFFSESLDLRVGLNWVHPFTKNWFISLGLSHTSGHVVDDSFEKQLEPLNVGIDGIPFRIVYDSQNLFRAGIHTLASLGSDPATRILMGGVFAEVYPFSGKTGHGLYVASDLYLPERSVLSLSTIEEVGYAYHGARVVFGFHSGADLRLKYQLFLKSTQNFWFSGLKFDW